MYKNPVAIASDHAGFGLKQTVAEMLKAKGVDVLDLGTGNEDSVDYPDFADTLADAIKEGKAVRGILICGSGIGISIAANRHRHIRAALCHSREAASLSRQHNNANVLALGARLMEEKEAKACVETFLTTEFEGGRHQKRIDKLSEEEPPWQ
jgi:ribose 5-phosphate isomerase B